MFGLQAFLGKLQALGWGLLRSQPNLQPAAFNPHSLRWVVVDVETSGLDTRVDRLLAIAGVALELQLGPQAWTLRIVPSDSFEVVVQQQQVSSRENILLHGIGAQAQRSGVPLPDAMTAFERWRAGAPLVAFHAWFDQAMLGQALAQVGQQYNKQHWLDIQPLALSTLSTPQRPQLNPAQKSAAQSLDFWLDRHAIPCHPRHRAMVDAYAEAQLLLQLWQPIVQRCGRGDGSADGSALWAGLQRLAGSVKYL